MRKIGVEIVGIGALKLTGFLKELMQRRSMTYESLYTVRTIKEVWTPLVQLILKCTHALTTSFLREIKCEN
jgi:hypothetical protein